MPPGSLGAAVAEEESVKRRSTPAQRSTSPGMGDAVDDIGIRSSSCRPAANRRTTAGGSDRVRHADAAGKRIAAAFGVVQARALAALGQMSV
jgi:hypothetical protein